MNKDKCINVDLSTNVRVNFTDSDAVDILSRVMSKYFFSDTIIVCIGTDKCIGDCLGPLIGTMLIKANIPYPVIGTLENPAHAVNLTEVINNIYREYENPFIIAIDACLGYSDYIGDIQIKKGPVHPGKGVGKTLPHVGDVSIIGIVDSLDVSDIFSIRGIRLNLIMKMAEVISSAILSATGASF